MPEGEGSHDVPKAGFSIAMVVDLLAVQVADGQGLVEGLEDLIFDFRDN
jgi:hypothetical protein